jgi:acetyltransferase-like isoleucine patch superfamily enzyme/acyl carrier protein
LNRSRKSARRTWRDARNRFALRPADVVGERIVLSGIPEVRNLGFMSIGTGVVIRSSPVASHLITAPGGALVVGDRVSIGHGASISASRSITIESGARIGAFAIIIDTDFHEVGQHDSSGAAAPIVIGAGAVLGSRVTILRGASIGAGASVGAGSVVSGVVQSGARVSGVPARESHSPVAAPPALVATLSAVLDVVAETFVLNELPDPAQTLESIEGWDSLGTLNLLLSLEERFGLPLSGEELFQAFSVADLADKIERAQCVATRDTDLQGISAAAVSDGN